MGRRIAIMAMVTVLTTVLCIAASIGTNGTVTDEMARIGRINKYTMTWTSWTNGYATATTRQLNGGLVRVTFNPDDTTNPTIAYTVTLLDEDGIDVLGGRAKDLSTNTSSSMVAGIPIQGASITNNALPYYLNGQLTLSVTRCGTNKVGTITLYIE